MFISLPGLITVAKVTWATDKSDEENEEEKEDGKEGQDEPDEDLLVSAGSEGGGEVRGKRCPTRSWRETLSWIPS